MREEDFLKDESYPGEKILGAQENMKDLFVGPKKPQRIILIGGSHYRPYQSAFIAAMLRDAGYEAEFVDSEKDPEEAKKILAVDDDTPVIGLSARIQKNMVEKFPFIEPVAVETKHERDYINDYVVMGGRRIGKHDHLAKLKIKNMRRR